MNKEKS